MVRGFAIRLLVLSIVVLVCVAVQAEETKPAADANAPLDVTATSPERDAGVEQWLDQPVSGEFGGGSLQTLVAYLDKHHIDAMLDLKSLEDSGIGSDTELPPLELSKISLRSMLRNLLEPIDVTFLVRDGKLLITTPDHASAATLTRIYRVHDLIHETTPTGDDIEDYDSLIELLTTTVDRSTWAEVGGPGSISSFQGTLVVSQTDATHDKLLRTLTALRESRARQDAHAAPDPIWAIWPADAALAQLLAKKSTERADFNFVETPLLGVASAISQKFNLPILLDRKALEDSGIGDDTPLTAELKQVSPQEAFELLLPRLDLAHIIRHEAIWITTPDKASAETLVVVYPVADLTQDGPPTVGAPRQDFDTIIELITSNIDPSTWDEVGGPGSITEFRATSCLAFSQTQHVHDQVSRLLAGLRAMRTAPPEQAQLRESVPAIGSMVTKTYSLAAHSHNAALARALRDIEPESWGQAGGQVRTGNHQLIVRNTPEVHEQIDKLLRDSRMLFTPSLKSNRGKGAARQGGGGMGGAGMGGMGGGMMGGGMGGGPATKSGAGGGMF